MSRWFVQCVFVCLSVGVWCLGVVSAQYLNEIFVDAVVSSNQIFGGSATEDAVGNTYQVFMFPSGTSVTIGEITLVNQGGLDTGLVKFDPLGNIDWVRSLQSPGYEEFFQVTTDPSGNVYVCGFTDTSQDGLTIDSQWDGIVAKYDTNGNLQFITNRYSSAYFSGQQEAIHTILYSNNYLYFVEVSTSNRFIIFQTDLQGIVQWSYTLPTVSMQSQPNFYQLAVDPLRNNLYVAGQIDGTWSSSVSNSKTVTGFVSQYWDGFLFAMSTSGFAQWLQPQQTGNYDTSRTLTVDSAGYVYVGGCIGASVDGQAYSGSGQCNPFVQKYDWNGNRQWSRIYNQYGGYVTESLVVDNTGAFYARAAYAYYTTNNQNVIKSDTNGNVIWIQPMPGATDTLVGCGSYLPGGWCRGGNSAYIDGSGALTLTGVYIGQFYGWASSQWVPYVSKWQLNITCQSCTQFDAVLGQLQSLLNVVVN